MPPEGSAAATPPASSTPASTAPSSTVAPVTQEAVLEAVEIKLSPAEMKKRLDETRDSTRKAMLKELGLGETLADAQKKVKGYSDLEKANMTEAERTKARLAELEPLEASNKELRAVVQKHAERELAKLTEAQRAAVASLAGDDPAKQLNAIAALMPTWATTAEAIAAATAQSANALAAAEALKVPTAQNTAPPAAAPKPGQVKNKFQQWDELSQDPAKGTHASLFYNMNRAEIERDRPQTG